MNCPNVFIADEFKKNESCQALLPDGRWVMARPLGWQGLMPIYRAKIAWKVFTGKYDAVKWIEQ